MGTLETSSTQGWIVSPADNSILLSTSGKYLDRNIKVEAVPPLTGNAQNNEVLKGKTFYSNNRTIQKTGSIETYVGNYAGYGISTNPDNSQIYNATIRNNAIDMGASFRYVNTTTVPNTNSEVYTFAEGSKGATVDLGITNNYRYVNAGAVYNKGKADGFQEGYEGGASSIQSTGTATAEQVLNGFTFSNASGTGFSGTIPINGSVSWNPTKSETKTYSGGYYPSIVLNSAGAYNAGYSAGNSSGYSTGYTAGQNSIKAKIDNPVSVKIGDTGVTRASHTFTGSFNNQSGSQSATCIRVQRSTYGISHYIAAFIATGDRLTVKQNNDNSSQNVLVRSGSQGDAITNAYGEAGTATIRGDTCWDATYVYVPTATTSSNYTVTIYGY